MSTTALSASPEQVPSHLGIRLAGQADYLYRCARLGWNFLRGGFIHCNLQVTYRCGFRCAICDFWKTAHDPSEELTLDQIRMVASKLRKLGSLIVSLAGGEPLVREDLATITSILAQAGHFPILITNGWHVTDARARDLLAAGLQEISVSIDYASAQRHDAMRGQPGAFDRAVQALERLRAHRVSPRQRVHLIAVLMDDNLDDIEPLILLARRLGVTFMVNLYSCNRGCKPTRPADHAAGRRLLALKRRYPEFVSLTSYLSRFDQAIATGGIGHCQTGRLLLNIDQRGHVARCTETLDQPVGNILTEPLLTIRDRLHARQHHQSCAACWTSCRGFAESMRCPPRSRQFREFLTSVRSHSPDLP